MSKPENFYKVSRFFSQSHDFLDSNSLFLLLKGWQVWESVNAVPKVVGFLRVLRFPPTGEVDRVA
jgi:hypothetical protein